MSFQSDAYSVKSKLHLSDTKPSVLIGVCVVVLAVVFLVLQFLFGLFSADSFEIVKPESASADEVVEPHNEVVVIKNTMYVHVAGAVASPGVIEVPQETRLFEAIEAVGGFTEGAATQSLNLAKILQDGEQIIVPTLEEIEKGVSEAPTSVGGPVSSSSSGLVNINTATQAELETLSGIGEATAKKIIAYREAKGTFKTVEDLKNVSGIGDKKYAALADMICV